MAGPRRGDSDAHADTVGIESGEVDGSGATGRVAHAATMPSDADALASQPTLAAGTAAAPLAAATLPVGDPARYARGAEVARGGMGRIVRADDRALGRAVAIKELTLDGGDAQRRFVREALVTARLQHPAIVPVYDAGTWPGGEPFYSMKLVAGRSLAEVIAATRTMEARLALLPAITAVAEAIAYAHAHRVIHRDLKPGNILVGDYGETIVIDWGLAKVLDEVEPDAAGAAPTAAADATRVGTVMGTPAYMPPEQALGDPLDERADVYALGAILYHVLGGRPPYDGATSDAVLSALIAGPPPPLEQLAVGIAPDLAAIVRRAMAPERAVRFASAGELVAELERFQNGQLIASHRYSVGERLWRFVRRHRTTLAVGALLGVALAVTAVEGMRRVVRERDRAEHLRGEAEAQRAQAQRFQADAEQRASALTLQQARASLTTDATAAIAWLTKLDPARPGWGAAHVIATAASVAGVGSARWRLPGAVERLELVDDHTLLLEGADRLWLRDLGNGRQVELPIGRAEGAGRHPIAVVPGGKGLIVARGPRASYYRFVGPLQVVVIELPPLVAPITDIVAASEQVVWLVDAEGTRHTVDLADGQIRSRASLGGVLTRVAIAAAGPAAAAAGPDGVYLLSPAPRKVSAGRAAFDQIVTSADGLAIAAAEVAPQAAVHVWDAVTGAERLVYRVSGTVTDVAFAPDGRHLAMATTSEVLEVTLPEGTLVHWRKTPATRVRYTASGRLLALTTDAVVVVASGETLVLGHPGVLDLLALPDGRVASAGRRADLRVWSVEGQLLPGRDDDAIGLPDLARDGRWVRVGEDAAIVAIDADHLRQALAEVGESQPSIRTTTVNGRKTFRIGELLIEGRRGGWAVTPDGATAVWLTEGGLEVGPRIGTGPVVHLRVDADEAARELVISADGTQVACVAGDTTLAFDVATGDRRELTGGPRDHLALSTDGALVAGIASEASWLALRVVSTRDGALLVDDRLTPAPDADPARFTITTALAADGRHAAVVTSDGRLRIWALGPARLARALDTAVAGTSAVSFTPDGLRVVVAGGDGRLRVIEVEGTAAPRVLRGPTSRLTAVAVSPDGRQLAAGDLRGGVWLWDVASGESVELWRHATEVAQVAFAPGGLLSISDGGGLRLLARPLPAEPVQLRRWLDGATSVRIDADDQAWTP